MSQLTLTVDPLGMTQRLAYDKSGNKTRETDVRSHTTAYVYDAADRLSDVADSTAATTTFTYNESGSLASVIDTRSKTITYSCDAADRFSGARFARPRLAQGYNACTRVRQD